MKICIVSTMLYAPWGGSEGLWTYMAHEALNRGHEVAIVLKHWPEIPAPVRTLRSRGATVFLRTVDLGRRWSRAFEELVSPFPKIVRWAPDVVLVNHTALYDLMYRNDVQRLLRALDRPYVAVVHQVYDAYTPIGNEYFRERVTRYYQEARQVAFVSGANRKLAERQLAIDLPNSCVIRIQPNLDRYEVAPWPSEAVARFACVGRLDVNDKGQDVLIECLAADPWSARDWTLCLHGKGRDEDYLRKLVHQRGIADRVIFSSHVSDVRSIWQDHHLNLMASRNEGTPASLVEAMLCGRPSVVSAVGGNPECIVEPRNGFLAEAPTLRSFGAALERAWAARKHWQTMGNVAYHDALGLIDQTPGQSLLELVTTVARNGSVGAAAEAGRFQAAPTKDGVQRTQH